MTAIVVAAVTGAGLVTGLLFAFSNCVMKALGDLPEDKGMFAMQRVNDVIINPLFIALFLGTPVLCGIIAIGAMGDLGASGNLYLLIGALVYLCGPFGITMFCNVPLNNRLAKAEPSDSADLWRLYQRSWLRWNHLRSFLGAISIVLLAVGLGSA